MNMRWLLAACVASGLLGAAQPASAGVTYSSYSVVNDQNVSLSTGLRAGSGEIQLVTANGVVSTFCDDIADELLGSGTFTSSAVVGGAVGAALNALLSNGSSLISSVSDASAALQVAIWQVLFSNVTVKADNPNVNTLADAFIGNVNSGLWQADPTREVVQLSALGNQSQIYLESVDEPQSIFVLGVACVALFAFMRRLPSFQPKA